MKKTIPTPLVALCIFTATSLGGAPTRASELKAAAGIAVTQLTRNLLDLQRPQGNWDGPFEGDPSTDAMSAMLAARIGEVDGKLRDAIIARCFSARVYSDGLWSAFPGGPADLNVTGMILHGLSALGVSSTDARVAAAWRWLAANGGWRAMHPMFQVFLAASEMIPFEQIPYVSPKFVALPRQAPVNVFNIGLVRAALVPLGVWSHYRVLNSRGAKSSPIDPRRIGSAGRRFGKALALGEPAAGMFAEGWSLDTENARKSFHELMVFVDKVTPLSKDFWAQESIGWLLASQQKDGTWAGTYQTTFLSVIALLEAHKAGVSDFTPEIRRAWRGLLSWRREFPRGNAFQQFSEGPVMETARVLTALQTAPREGLGWSDDSEKRAISWLLGRQILSAGDWSHRLPATAPGGWAYQYDNDRYPDVDDTAMVVEALARSRLAHAGPVREAVSRAVGWLVGMQNADGGFPVWEHETPVWLRKLFGLSLGMDVLIDPSESDVTSRAIRGFVAAAKNAPASERGRLRAVVENACRFLKKKAQADPQTGAPVWSGDWAVNYTYGTAEAIDAFLDARCLDASEVTPSVKWLVSRQNADGGWGESPSSYDAGRFVAAPSTPGQTAFVLNALLAYAEADQGAPPALTRSIENGVSFLLRYARGKNYKVTDESFMATIFKGRLYGQYIVLPHYETIRVLGRYLKAR